MSKHLGDFAPSFTTGSFLGNAPRHREVTPEFTPVTDVWTTPEDIKQQRREFDAQTVKEA